MADETKRQDPQPVDLAKAYRATVSAALQLQRALALEPGRRCVLEPAERKAYRRWRDTGAIDNE